MVKKLNLFLRQDNGENSKNSVYKTEEKLIELFRKKGAKSTLQYYNSLPFKMDITGKDLILIIDGKYYENSRRNSRELFGFLGKRRLEIVIYKEENIREYETYAIKNMYKLIEDVNGLSTGDKSIIRKLALDVFYSNLNFKEYRYSLINCARVDKSLWAINMLINYGFNIREQVEDRGKITKMVNLKNK